MAAARMAPVIMGIASCTLLAATFVDDVVPTGGAATAGGVGPGTFARACLALIVVLSAVTLMGSGKSGEPVGTAGPPATLADAVTVIAVLATSVLFGWLTVNVSVAGGVALLCISWLLIAGERQWSRITSVAVAAAAASCALVLVTGAHVEGLVL